MENAPRSSSRQMLRIGMLVVGLLSGGVVPGRAQDQQTGQASASGGEQTPSEIPERDLVSQRIRICEKYRDVVIPLVIQQLKRFNMGPDPAPELQRLVASPVLEYAHDLETTGGDDADRATVRNETYWKAIFILGYDNTALSSRLFLLMRDGYLKRADMVLLHCFYEVRADGGGLSTKNLGLVQADIRTIEEESNALVREGIKAWDRLGRQEAIALYHKALGIYPKNPWALYELGLDREVYQLGDSLKGAVRFLDTRDPADAQAAANPYFRLVRRLDPMYTLAYQGIVTPEFRAAASSLVDKVGPSYQKLWRAEDVLGSMRTLADGYREMGEHEYALYAYKFLLYRTFDNGFDEEVRGHIATCLAALGMERVDAFLTELLGAFTP